MFPIDFHAVKPIAQSRHTESGTISIQSINRQQLDLGYGHALMSSRIPEAQIWLCEWGY
jgi:hypothetical protein